MKVRAYAPGAKSKTLKVDDNGHIVIKENHFLTNKGWHKIPHSSLVRRTSLVATKSGYSIKEDYIFVTDFSKLKINTDAKIVNEHLAIPGVVFYDIVDTIVYEESFPENKEEKDKHQLYRRLMQQRDPNIVWVQWEQQ